VSVVSAKCHNLALYAECCYAECHGAFQNAPADLAMAISYERKMFMKLTPADIFEDSAANFTSSILIRFKMPEIKVLVDAKCQVKMHLFNFKKAIADSFISNVYYLKAKLGFSCFIY
jgi:hypothetical protein